MIELNMSFFIQMVNFLILLAILNLVFYRPIRKIIQQRSEKMSADLTDIENFNKEAEEKMKEYEAALNQAQQEGVKVRNEMKAEGAQEEKSMLNKASKEAGQYLDKERVELSKQEEEAKNTLDQQVDEYAKLVADKVVVKA